MLWETGRREQSPGDKFRLDGTAGPSTVLGRTALTCPVI